MKKLIIILFFITKSSFVQAIETVAKQGILYDVIPPQPRKFNIKSYADNFSSDRKISWTH